MITVLQLLNWVSCQERMRPGLADGAVFVGLPLVMA
jgi:hypothetical protein